MLALIAFGLIASKACFGMACPKILAFTKMEKRLTPKSSFLFMVFFVDENVNLDTLQLLVDNGMIKDTVDMTDYISNRLATKNETVKILGRGELKAKLKISAHKFTATAKAAIEAAGGEAVTL